MPIALVSSVSKAGPSGGGTTGAIDTTGATLLILCVSADGTVATPTDSKGNTWTQLTATAGTPKSIIFYAENPIVGTGHTFTYSRASSFPVITASAWSGAATASVFDQQNGASAGTGSTGQPGSVTPSEDNELVIAMCGHQVASYTINGGFTELSDHGTAGGVNYGGGATYLIQTTAAAANPTFTFSGSGPWSAKIATFKAAAAPPATNRRRRIICGAAA